MFSLFPSLFYFPRLWGIPKSVRPKRREQLRKSAWQDVFSIQEYLPAWDDLSVDQWNTVFHYLAEPSPLSVDMSNLHLTPLKKNRMESIAVIYLQRDHLVCAETELKRRNKYLGVHVCYVRFTDTAQITVIKGGIERRVLDSRSLHAASGKLEPVPKYSAALGNLITHRSRKMTGHLSRLMRDLPPPAIGKHDGRLT